VAPLDMLARMRLGLRIALVTLASALACGPSTPADDTSGDTSSAGATTETSDGEPPTTAGPGDTSMPDDDGPADATTLGTVTTVSTGDTTDDDDTGPSEVDGPTHLLIIRTPHGVYEDQVWSDALVLVDGVENVIHLPEGAELTNMYGVTSSSILTGGLLGSVTGESPWVYYSGGGPSLDVVLGDALGSRTPHANVHLGVFATDIGGMPTGVSYTGADQPLLPIDSPTLAFASLFAGIDDPLLDPIAERVDAPFEGPVETLEVQLMIAAAAIQLDVTRVQLLSIDRGLPSIMWSELGVFQGYHEVVANDDHASVQMVQTMWAEQIAGLLLTLDATPDGAGTLLDRTLVVWMSAEGSPPNAYSTSDVFIVIVDRSGTFATGRIADVEGDQADFAATIAAALSAQLRDFGHPDLDATVIDELLAR
jgi:hypothetical protein